MYVNPKFHSRLFRGIIWLHVRLALARPAWHRDTLNVFRGSLGGALPKAGPGGIILAACNDLYYDKFAKTLLYSLERLQQKQRVHLHLYEPCAATLSHIECLKQAFACAEISYTIDPCLLAKDQPYQINYYALARFPLVSILLEETGSPVLCVDVDAIAIQPVWQAYESWRTKGDVGLIFRDNVTRPWRRILASAVGFNPTSGGKAYCSTVARALLSLLRRKSRYHLDQIVLHYAAQASRSAGQATFFEMPLHFSDFEFHPDSIIWTAKGRRKAADAFQDRKQVIDAAFEYLHCAANDHPLEKTSRT
jgi:hypothetical protein